MLCMSPVYELLCCFSYWFVGDLFSFSSLPTLDKKTKEKVDKDIDNARDFIKEYL